MKVGAVVDVTDLYKTWIFSFPLLLPLPLSLALGKDEEGEKEEDYKHSDAAIVL